MLGKNFVTSYDNQNFIQCFLFLLMERWRQYQWEFPRTTLDQKRRVTFCQEQDWSKWLKRSRLEKFWFWYLASTSYLPYLIQLTSLSTCSIFVSLSFNNLMVIFLFTSGGKLSQDYSGIAFVLLTCNYSFNFYFYCLINQDIRKIVLKVFKR